MKELAPFLVQGALLSVDEFYCHRRRLLRRWERWGHPMDTAAFASCLIFLRLAPPTTTNLWIYAGIATFSSLLISKDEWQHKELCNGLENWLHALLFTIHPVALIWAGWLWWTDAAMAAQTLFAAMLMSLGFFFYQAIYWNLVRAD